MTIATLFTCVRVKLGMQWDEAKEYTAGQLLSMLRIVESEATRQDYRTAKLAWLYAESHRDREKKPEPFHEFDFMPGWVKRPMSEAEAIAKFKKLWSPPSAREQLQSKNKGARTAKAKPR